jgi:hypothetical protein
MSLHPPRTRTSLSSRCVLSFRVLGSHRLSCTASAAGGATTRSTFLAGFLVMQRSHLRGGVGGGSEDGVMGWGEGGGGSSINHTRG